MGEFNEVLGVPDFIWIYGIAPAFIFNLARQKYYQSCGAKMDRPAYWFLQLFALFCAIVMNNLVKVKWEAQDMTRTYIEKPIFHFPVDVDYKAFEAVSYNRKEHKAETALFITLNGDENATYKVYKKNEQHYDLLDYLQHVMYNVAPSTISNMEGIEVHDEYGMVDQNVLFSRNHIFVKWHFADYNFDTHWKIDRSEMDCPYSIKNNVGLLTANKYQKSSRLCPFDRSILLTYYTGLGIDWTFKSFARFSLFHSLLGIHYIAAAAHVINKRKSIIRITKGDRRYLQVSLGLMIVTGWRQAYQMCVDPLTPLYTLQPTGMWSVGISGIGIGLMAQEMFIFLCMNDPAKEKSNLQLLAAWTENYQYIVFISGAVYALKSELYCLMTTLAVIWTPGILCMMRSQYYLVCWTHDMFTDNEEKVMSDLFWRLMVVFPMVMVSSTMNVRSIPGMEPLNIMTAAFQIIASIGFGCLYYPNAAEAQYNHIKLLLFYPKPVPESAKSIKYD